MGLSLPPAELARQDSEVFGAADAAPDTSPVRPTVRPVVPRAAVLSGTTTGASEGLAPDATLSSGCVRWVSELLCSLETPPARPRV